LINQVNDIYESFSNVERSYRAFVWHENRRAIEENLDQIEIKYNRENLDKIHR